MRRVTPLIAAVVLSALTALSAGGCAKPARDPPTTRVVARVVVYTPAAEWDHYADGAFQAFDQMQVAVVAPAVFEGRVLKLRLPAGKLPEDSPLRQPEAKLVFGVAAPLLREPNLDWGQLENPQPLE